MPKIDPITGCTVLTFFEAMHDIGQSSDPPKEAHEVAAEIFDEFDKDDRRIENEYKDPANALKLVLDHIAGFDPDDDPEFVPPAPVEIEVLGADSKGGFGGHDSGFVAKGRTADGTILFYSYVEWNDYGDRMSPPDGGEEIQWYTEDQIQVTDEEKTFLRDTIGYYGRTYGREGVDEGTKELVNNLRNRGLVAGYPFNGRVKLTELGRFAIGMSWEELEEYQPKRKLGQ
jgi:hypothetical protein